MRISGEPSGRHGKLRSDGEVARDSVEGLLKQPTVLLAKAIFALLKRSYEMRLCISLGQYDTSTLCPLRRLRYVEQNLLNFAVMRLVQGLTSLTRRGPR